MTRYAIQSLERLYSLQYIASIKMNALCAAKPSKDYNNGNPKSAYEKNNR